MGDRPLITQDPLHISRITTFGGSDEITGNRSNISMIVGLSTFLIRADFDFSPSDFNSSIIVVIGHLFS